MTATRMKEVDLRRWNLIQAHMLKQLGVSNDADRVWEFGAWFAKKVDQLERLPRFNEAEEAINRRGRVTMM